MSDQKHVFGQTFFGQASPRGMGFVPLDRQVPLAGVNPRFPVQLPPGPHGTPTHAAQECPVCQRFGGQGFPTGRR